ncbi:MAG: MIP/aquaporin family protein [Ignavibacteria bacterium]
MHKYITELIGTFFLVLVIGLSNNPIAIGSILMVMIYMGAHISGAHYNPAVSLAVLMRGKMNSKDFVMYVIFQVIGAFIAALVYLIIIGNTFAPSPGLGVPFWKSTLTELIFTFALASVILNVATSKRTEGNNYFGLAIGFTVLASAFAAGPISGGAFNSAVGIGPILMDTINGGSSMNNILIYIIGPLLGGALAAIVYKIINPEEFTAS